VSLCTFGHFDVYINDSIDFCHFPRPQLLLLKEYCQRRYKPSDAAPFVSFPPLLGESLTRPLQGLGSMGCYVDRSSSFKVTGQSPAAKANLACFRPKNIVVTLKTIVSDNCVILAANHVLIDTTEARSV